MVVIQLSFCLFLQRFHDIWASQFFHLWHSVLFAGHKLSISFHFIIYFHIIRLFQMILFICFEKLIANSIKLERILTQTIKFALIFQSAAGLTLVFRIIFICYYSYQFLTNLYIINIKLTPTNITKANKYSYISQTNKLSVFIKQLIKILHLQIIKIVAYQTYLRQRCCVYIFNQIGQKNICQLRTVQIRCIVLIVDKCYRVLRPTKLNALISLISNPSMSR